MVVANKSSALEGFDQFIKDFKRPMQLQYDRSINRDLSQQNWQGLFKRNVTLVLRQAYIEIINQLKQLPAKSGVIGLDNNTNPLATEVLGSMDDFVDGFVQFVLQKHRTSCALSNFPDEHRPSEEYIAETLELIEQDWQSFVSQVNIVMTRVMAAG
jgi:uncharacterized protein YecA (UPF0149 family)